MDYVFFDIECANCIEGQAKICSFGYVVTDEQFDVIEREDLIVNPLDFDTLLLQKFAEGGAEDGGRIRRQNAGFL